MGASNATLGKGTLLQRDTYPATNNFTSIAEVLDISGPKRSKSFEDVTHQESPTNYKEKLPQIKDGGQVTFTCHLLPADPTQDNTTGLGKDFEDDILRNYRTRYTNKDGSFSYRYYQGYVANLEEAAPVQAKKTLNVTIELTGPVTDVAPAV